MSLAGFDKEYWVEGEGLLKIKKWLEDGLHDKQVAQNMGINPSTLAQWRKKYDALGFVYKQARKVACQELVNAAFKSALGYHVTEDAIDRNGNIVEVKRYIAPMSQTQQFLLKNWLPEEYKDKRDMTIEGALPVILAGEDQLKD